ncbi:MAG: hypothetical protein KH334_02755 [Clostridiales bacterium]|nr:hypothetical protein [Clostridiales bacterium]
MNPSSTAPGKNYLLVTGILLVIFSVYSLIGVIAALVVSLASLSLGALGVILLLSTLVASAIVIVDFIAGIMGIVNREKPEKAKTCMGLGITMLVFSCLGILSSMSSGDFNFFSTLCSLVLPILYTIGASKNKAAAQQQQQNVNF